MPEPESDLIVVGAGPGGYAAAFMAADKGMRVILIDSVRAFWEPPTDPAVVEHLAIAQWEAGA